MWISVDALIDVLKTAREKDLDDDILTSVEREHMAVKLYLNEHAWKKLKEHVSQKHKRERSTEGDKFLHVLETYVEEGLIDDEDEDENDIRSFSMLRL